MERLRADYRVHIAHGNVDQAMKLLMDPADVRIDQRVDAANSLAVPLLRASIQDEWNLIESIAATPQTHLKPVGPGTGIGS